MNKRVAKKIVGNHSLGRCNYSGSQKRKAYKINAKHATEKEIIKTAYAYANTLLRNSEVRIYLHEEQDGKEQATPQGEQAGTSHDISLPEQQEG